MEFLEGSGEVKRAHRPCVACEEFGISPVAPAVDPTGRSMDEADRLCRTHRARMTEGYCVLCTRALPWVTPFLNSAIGCCRACFVGRFGEEEARRIEARKGRRRAG